LVSFDVKGAYNGVYKDRLLQRLAARGIPPGYGNYTSQWPRLSTTVTATSRLTARVTTFANTVPLL
jgi:hypothetical protein